MKHFELTWDITQYMKTSENVSLIQVYFILLYLHWYFLLLYFLTCINQLKNEFKKSVIAEQYKIQNSIQNIAYQVYYRYNLI